MIIYDLGRNVANTARDGVASIFDTTRVEMNNSKAKKLKKNFTLVGMINHLTYNIWSSQYNLVQKILTVHQEIGKEDYSWEEKYELLEAELEIMYIELERYADKKYQLHLEKDKPPFTTFKRLSERKKLWSINLLEQNNLQAISNEETKSI